MIIWKIPVAFLIGYFLGSINIAIIITKYIMKSDIRKSGSKNAGATNVARVFGMKIGLITLCGDFLKTAAAMLIGKLVLGSYGDVVAAFGCIIGHCWPVYFNFRGGKGVATGACIALMLDWRLFLAILSVFAIIFALSKIVSLASIAGAVCFPITQLILGNNGIYIALGVVIAILVVIMHRANIVRLINHTEAKFVPKNDKKA